MASLVAVLYVLLALAILLTIAAVALSFLLTRRHYLRQTRSPAELGLSFENVQFRTSDGLTLRGWWIPAADSGRAIIQLHGHGGSMDPDIEYVPAWHAAGFSVLMFDLRAHGRSEGNVCTFGYLERRDVQAAVRFLQQEKGVRRIGLLGFSLGGMVSILSAPGCPDVDAVVEDGAPARLRTAVTTWGLEHRLPSWLASFAAWLVIAGASLRLQTNLFRYEPVRWIGQIAPRPLMIVHGELDRYCPDFEDLLAHARPTEVWRVPDKGHVQAIRDLPEEYYRRVTGFLGQSL